MGTEMNNVCIGNFETARKMIHLYWKMFTELISDKAKMLKNWDSFTIDIHENCLKKKNSNSIYSFFIRFSPIWEFWASVLRAFGPIKTHSG